MKFIVDNQLPIALAQHLQQSGMDCQHVLDVGLAEASDAEICRYAEEHNAVIISKDEDFLHLVKRPESRLKFVWVRLGNCRTAALLSAVDHFWPTLESCLDAGDRIVELR